MNAEIKKIYDVAVIGSGAAGQMAMLRGVLNNLETLIFMGDAQTMRRSRATWVTEVDNVPGMFDKKRPITATSKEVIDFIQKQEGFKNKLTVVRKAVTHVRKENNIFTLDDGANTYQAHFVVLCTGTMDVQPHIQGSIEPVFPFANRGDFLYCIRCDGHRTLGSPCAVIGDQSGAGWIAIMLKERYDNPKLWVLTNGKPFNASEQVRGLLEKYKIEIIEEEIQEILGDAREGLKGFRFRDTSIETSKAFVALGSMVYNQLAKEVGVKLNERDHVIVNDKNETSVEGFYAAGDLVAGRKKQVYTAWDDAVDAVDAIDEKIRIRKRNA